MNYLEYTSPENWTISEVKFLTKHQGKCESIMCQGNGYLGLRNSIEEDYANKKPGLFVAGTFNKCNDDEVCELPNVANPCSMQISINDNNFSMLEGKSTNYRREINLKTGETTRTLDWLSPDGALVKFIFSRFVSMHNKHLIMQRLSIVSDKDIDLKIRCKINGQITNSGAMHMDEGDKRFYEKKYMQFCQTTSQTKYIIAINRFEKVFINNSEVDIPVHISSDRRAMFKDYEYKLKANNEFVMESFINIHTSIDDKDHTKSIDELKQYSLQSIKSLDSKRYSDLLNDSKEAWNNLVWNTNAVNIKCDDPYDQLALRFAQYHLHVMTPVDERMNIGAKGLSGEGYKGHTFWDTEIFILPYFIYTHPEIAKSLLKYRYLSLIGARQKAELGGYSGAQYPWESAGLADAEVCPILGGADINTGKPSKVMCGFIEIHITADVVYGIWEYYKATGDEQFMQDFGYEIVFDTAKFWGTRFEFDEADGKYHINNVIGPDEYKEFIDDNAYTNYMAKWNLQLAISYYNKLKENNKKLFDKLNEKLKLDKYYDNWNNIEKNVYLQLPNSDGVLPQDNTYLSLKKIDLTKYKNQENVGSIFKDYSIIDVGKMQVSKQADVMLLLLLMENLFPLSVKQASWNYYEPLTLHDSSLSLSTHSILAGDMNNYDLAYKLYKQACDIDMGPNMKTSDAGIHSASLGGIWQCAVFGFAGIRMIDGNIHIRPKMPKTWHEISFRLIIKGATVDFKITKDKIYIENHSNNEDIYIYINGEKQMINGKVCFDY